MSVESFKSFGLVEVVETSIKNFDAHYSVS